MLTEEEFETIVNDKSCTGAARHLSALKEPFSTFVREAIIRYGSAEKLNEANRVADFLLARLKKRGMYEDPRNAEWVAITYTAALVHNLFYDGSITSLFLARQELKAIAEEVQMQDNHFEFICQHIEGQLGDDCPVAMCKVKDDSPQGILALARWFVVELGGSVPLDPKGGVA